MPDLAERVTHCLLFIFCAESPHGAEQVPNSAGKTE